MKRTAVMITDDIERAIERYQQKVGTPLELDVVVQQALREYLSRRGYAVEDSEDSVLVIRGIGPKPQPMENPPILLDGSTVAEAVIEDRR
jgi:hypothetical protein